MTPQLLAEVVEAADKLSVGRTTIYKLAAAGEIEFVKIGRKTLVPVASLEAYVERLRETPAGPRGSARHDTGDLGEADAADFIARRRDGAEDCGGDAA